MDMERQSYMALALDSAATAKRRDEVPVGAVVVHAPSQRVVGRAGNQMRDRNDPSAHAEILALRAAGTALGTARLDQCDLYVTLEPCTMCAGAISLARIRRLYFGALDPKAGAVENGVRFFQQPSCHHAPEVYGGIDADRAGDLLRDYFQKKR